MSVGVKYQQGSGGNGLSGLMSVYNAYNQFGGSGDKKQSEATAPGTAPTGVGGSLGLGGQDMSNQLGSSGSDAGIGDSTYNANPFGDDQQMQQLNAMHRAKQSTKVGLGSAPQSGLSNLSGIASTIAAFV